MRLPHTEEFMKALKFIRYFFPEGELLKEWNEYKKLNDFRQFLIESQDKLGLYTLRIRADDIAAISLEFKEPCTSMYDLFRKQNKKATYLGIDVRVSRLKATSRLDNSKFRWLSDNLNDHYNWFISFAEKIQNISSDLFICDIQLLVKDGQVLPIVAVYDQIGSDLKPLFDPPAGKNSWLEIPVTVFDLLIYSEDSYVDILTFIKEAIGKGDYVNDWSVLEVINSLIAEHNANAQSWPNYVRQEHENRIHTLLDISKRSGIDAYSLFKRK